MLKIKESLVQDYAQMTGQTRERIIKELDRDNYMSAQEALAFGLIDKIAEPMAAAKKKEMSGEWIDPVRESEAAARPAPARPAARPLRR